MDKVVDGIKFKNVYMTLAMFSSSKKETSISCVLAELIGQHIFEFFNLTGGFDNGYDTKLGFHWKKDSKLEECDWQTPSEPYKNLSKENRTVAGRYFIAHVLGSLSESKILPFLEELWISGFSYTISFTNGKEFTYEMWRSIGEQYNESDSIKFLSSEEFKKFVEQYKGLKYDSQVDHLEKELGLSRIG